MYSTKVDLEKKLAILSEAAKYDASCASSGSSRSAAASRGAIGATRSFGICHSWAADGRCISLLKLLFTNHCIYDCAYCVNRSSADIQRTAFTVDEVVQLTIDFYKRNYIEGLFLSSGITGDPDYTMRKLAEVARRLRTQERFSGYIHLKAIPGAGQQALEIAGRYADRLSVNIELPSERSLTALAPQKTKGAIVGTMAHVADRLAEVREDRRRRVRHSPGFAPAGQSTQLIVGASPESDRTIATLAAYLYRNVQLRRVYYSAFMPVTHDTRLPALAAPPLRREHRLYQVDWLIRLYRFDVDEVFHASSQNVELDLDPKAAWALRNLNRFPVDVQHADYELLLRVPGIGLRTAARIVQVRRRTRLRFDTLRRLGVVLKRARYFVTCDGTWLETHDRTPEQLRALLTDVSEAELQQLSLFAPAGPAVSQRSAGERPAAGAYGATVAAPVIPTVRPRSVPVVPAVVLVFDGSFAGLLSAVRELVDRGPSTGWEVAREDRLPDLFSEVRRVSTQRATSAYVATQLASQPSRLELLYDAFLAEQAVADTAIAVYAAAKLVADRSGTRLPDAAQDALITVEHAARRVRREAHTFLGILRFRHHASGWLVAEYESECNVLPIVASHFARRMPNQQWRIFDRRRGHTAMHDRSGLRYRSDAAGPTTGDVQTDAAIVDMWRDYVDRIAIRERTNRRLQRQFLPKKYWRDLPEMDRSRTERPR